MNKFLIMGILLSTLLLQADTFLGTPIGIQAKSKIKQEKKTLKKKNQKSFKKNHHKFDKRYRDFNYERQGYYNNDGYYYGYYDQRGYFFDNVYFEYDSRYTYDDRHALRGYFEPRHSHHRVYHYHDYNNWNRTHCDRTPTVIVHEYYNSRPRYYNPPPERYNYYRPRDNGHIREGNLRQERRDQYRNEHRYNNHHPRDNGQITHGRFRDKSIKRNKNTGGGVLSISK